MAQTIEIPGVGPVEFPDEMGDEEILAAVKKLADEAEASRPPVALASAIPASESALRGWLQGITMGWSDEVAAPMDALAPGASRAFNPDVLAAAPNDADYATRKAAALEYYRRRNAEAQRDNPKTYLAGQVAGATAPTLLGGAPATGARALAIAAGQGAAQGAGYSDATTGRGLASDTLGGATLGLAGYGTGALLGKGLSAARGLSRRIRDSASARAGAQASKEVAEEVASKAGQLGAETQKGSRYIENLMRLEASMTPEQKALYAQLQASGVVPDLQQSVARGTLEALPGQAATIAAKREALREATSSAPVRALSRTQELLKPQVGQDARSFLKAYGEPLAWAYGGNKVAEMLGADADTQMAAAGVAGLIGGRTRAGKALVSRLTRPGNQAALADTIRSLAAKNKERALRRALSVGAPAALAARVANADEEKE